MEELFAAYILNKDDKNKTKTTYMVTPLGGHHSIIIFTKSLSLGTDMVNMNQNITLMNQI
jgi:hypothetical protein